MDGWLEGWTDGRRDGRMARKNSNEICFPAAVCCDYGMNLYVMEV